MNPWVKIMGFGRKTDGPLRSSEENIFDSAKILSTEASTEQQERRDGPSPDALAVATRTLRVVCLHTNHWKERRSTWRADDEPDPLAVDRGLEREGIDMRTIDPGRWPSNPMAGSRPMLRAIDPLRALKVLLCERDADLILSTNEGPALLPIVMGGLARFSVPIIIIDPILSDGWRLRNYVLDRVIKRADAILLMTSWQKSYISERWGRSYGLEVVGYCVDTDFWHAQPTTSSGLILSVGDDHSRDFELFLSATQELNVEIVLRTSVKIQTASMPKNTTQISNRISAKKLRSLYSQSQIVVIPLRPSLNAGGINTFFEALACGRPIIISDNPAIRDFLRHEENCLVVPCGDQSAMREAIVRLLNEPATCALLSANARRYAEEFLSPVRFCTRLAEVLRRYARVGDH